MSGGIVVFVMIRRPPPTPASLVVFYISASDFVGRVLSCSWNNLVYTLVPRKISALLWFLGRAGCPFVVAVNCVRCPEMFRFLLWVLGRMSVRWFSLSILPPCRAGCTIRLRCRGGWVVTNSVLSFWAQEHRKHRKPRGFDANCCRGRLGLSCAFTVCATSPCMGTG